MSEHQAVIVAVAVALVREALWWRERRLRRAGQLRTRRADDDGHVSER